MNTAVLLPGLGAHWNIFYNCKMNALKEIRTRFGISKHDIARQLGISWGLVCLVEKGFRNLPTKALIKLSDLCGYMYNEAGIPKVSNTYKFYDAQELKEENSIVVILRKRKDQSSDKISELKKQLEKMKRDRQKAVSQLELMGTSFNNICQDDKANRRRHSNGVREHNVYDRYIANSPEEQEKIKQQIKTELIFVNSYEKILHSYTH